MIGASAASSASTACAVADATVRRSDRIPDEETGGIARRRRRPRPARDRSARRCARGRFLDAATGRVPVGRARRGRRARGSASTGPARCVWLGGRWFTVVGILDPVRARARARPRGADRLRRRRARCSAPTASRRTVYVRADPDRVVARVRDVLGRDRQPRAPRGGRGQPPVRRARRARRRPTTRLHRPVPRPRRGGAARRRRSASPT